MRDNGRAVSVEIQLEAASKRLSVLCRGCDDLDLANVVSRGSYHKGVYTQVATAQPVHVVRQKALINGVTVLHITHNKREVDNLAASVANFNANRLLGTSWLP